ncbi:hypothetical protein TNCV_1474161 [Trichonephila clavipes]|nr:hypothetical protein TNCV_1474161 [Trichonephila clavipes]
MRVRMMFRRMTLHALSTIFCRLSSESGDDRHVAGLDLSLRFRHTRTRRLLLDKQKHDSSESTSRCNSIIHIALALKIEWSVLWNQWQILNRFYKCKLLSSNPRIIVVVDMGTSKVSSTCCKMVAEVGMGSPSFFDRCVDPRVDVTLATLVTLKLSIFPCSNYPYYRFCTMDAPRCASSDIRPAE